jgi:hypothetical protein
MSVAPTLTEAPAKISRATKELLEKIAEMRQAIDEKKAEMSRHLKSPLPLADVRRNIGDVVRKRGERWLAENGNGDRWLAQYGRALLQADARVGKFALAQFNAEGRRGMLHLPGDNLLMSFDALCAAYPDQAQALLLGLFDKMATAGTYEPGLPAADRLEVIPRLEGELSALEAEEELAVDSALAAGATIEHRKAVTLRRKQEESRAERQRRNEKEQAELLKEQEARDLAHAQAIKDRNLPSRGATSSYLEARRGRL